MKHLTISLPSFGGFYESLWLNSDTEYYAMHELQDMYGELKHADDWYVSDNYRLEVAERYTAFIEELLHDMDLKCDLLLSDIWSPKYYNFYTDRIYAVIEWADDYDFAKHLLTYMRKHQPRLSQLIHRYHTSYDGFISFMDNTYTEWYNRFVTFDENAHDGDLYLSYLLAYLIMCENDCENLRDLDYLAYEHLEIMADFYIEPQTDEARAEWELVQIRMRQTA